MLVLHAVCICIFLNTGMMRLGMIVSFLYAQKWLAYLFSFDFDDLKTLNSNFPSKHIHCSIYVTDNFKLYIKNITEVINVLTASENINNSNS